MKIFRRDPEKEQLWRARIDEWKRSPENVVQFCRNRGLNEHTFRAWQKTVSERDAEEREQLAKRPRMERQQVVVPDRVTFAAVTVVEDGSAATASSTTSVAEHFEIILTGGAIIRLPMKADVALISTIVKILERSC